VECLAQAGTALLEVSTDFKKKALLVLLERAKFRALVHPGDQLTIAVKILSIDDRFVQMDGTIHVSERLVVNARLVFTLRNIDEFYPPKTKHLMETIYDFWLKDAQIVGAHEKKEERQ
jgi:acyl-CoA thioesterase FadM